MVSEQPWRRGQFQGFPSFKLWQKWISECQKIYALFSQLNDKFLDCLTFLLFSQIAKICSLNACQHFDVMPRVGPGSRNLSSVRARSSPPRYPRIRPECRGPNWRGQTGPGPTISQLLQPSWALRTQDPHHRLSLTRLMRHYSIFIVHQ